MDSGLSALKMSMKQLEWRSGFTEVSRYLYSSKKYAAVDRDGTTIDEVVQLSFLIFDPS